MLLTIPAAPEKGEFQTYTLDVSDLIDLVDNVYYADESNWKKVIVAYRSSTGNQLNLISFIPDGNPTISSQIFFASQCFSIFAIQSITIFDNQNGSYVLNPSEIPDVNDYTIFFLADVAGSWFNVFGQGGNDNKLSFNQTSSELYVGTGYDAFYGSRAYFGAAIQGVSGSISDTISDLINHFETTTYFVNAAQTKIYVIGRYDLTYFSSVLPSVTSGPNYAVSPPRLLSIDVATGEVTWLADIETLGTKSNFGGTAYTLIVDEVLNLAICAGQLMISAYSTLSGASVWSKDSGLAPLDPSWAEQYPRKMVDFGSDFIVVASAYDGAILPGKIPLRISKVSGLDTGLLPVQPLTAYGYTPFWSVTPDLSKIVVAAQVPPSGGAAFTYYDGVSWSSEIAVADAMNQCNSLVAANDYIIYQSGNGKFSKLDYAGANVPGFTSPVWPAFTAPGFNNPLAIVDGKILSSSYYSRMVQLDATSGALATNFKGILGYGDYFIVQTIDSLVFVINRFSGSVNTPMKSLPVPSSIAYGSVGVIDFETASLTNIITSDVGDTMQTSGASIMGSALYPDLVLYLNSSSNFRAYNKTTESYDSGWPTNISGSIKVSSLIDNYIYLLNYAASSMSFSDSEGTFTSSASLVRVNLTTKSFDRTFGVTIPGYTGNYSGIEEVEISATIDYIYVSVPGQVVCRVKKSDSSLEIITPATLGLSMPSFSVTGRLNFKRIGTNKLVVFCDKAGPSSNSTSLDNKPYILVTEDTLTQSYTQPSEYPNDRGLSLVVNTDNQELSGVIFDVVLIGSPGGYFVTYNLVTNARSVSQNLTTGAEETGIFFDVTMKINFVVKDSNYYMYFTKSVNANLQVAYVLNYRPYIGIVKMNPMGIITE